MGTRYLLTAALLLAALPADAQVTCLRNFAQIICSDGRNALVTPDGTIWSDGSSVYRNGDQIFINPPATPAPSPYTPLDPYRSRRRPPQ